MTQRETNSINMIEGVLTFFASDPSKWNNEAPIEESIEYLNGQKTRFDAQAEQQIELQTTYLTEEKNVGLAKAITLAYIMAKRIKVFAVKTGNTKLATEVNFAKSSLDDGSFQEITGRLNLIVKRATENLPLLDKYKVNQEEITLLQNTIDTIISKPAERKAMTGRGVETTATMQTLLAEMLKKLNDELDDEVEALIDNEEYVAAYFAVRRTDDRRGRGPSKKDEV